MNITSCLRNPLPLLLHPEGFRGWRRGLGRGGRFLTCVLHFLAFFRHALSLLSCFAGLALVLAPLGCSKHGSADATHQLQQSFQTAEPEVKQGIEAVNSNLKAGNYAEASKALAPIVTSRNLTDPQRQAVGVALQQISQAIAANPALDTKEMYDLRLKMYRAYDSGKRF